MATNKLTDAAVKQAVTKATDYKLSDGGGLYLLVKNTGAKYWRLAYRFAAKQKTLALGVYDPSTRDSVSLKSARIACAAAKELRVQGADPAQAKQQQKRQDVLENTNQFSVIAREWWEHQKGTWSEDYASRLWGRLEVDVFPYIGSLPVTK